VRTAGLLVAAARVLVALVSFAFVFLAIFWTPAVLLSLFALVYAADSRAFSRAHDSRRRVELLVSSLRRYRGGWLDSPTTAP
jgi:hypothetical protein